MSMEKFKQNGKKIKEARIYGIINLKKMGVNLIFSLKCSGGYYIEERLKVFCTFPDDQTGVQR